MDVEWASTPEALKPGQLVGKIAVVFDILRATTSIVNALSNGATGVVVASSIEEAKGLYDQWTGGPKLLAGEVNCLRPDGFDLGNSPQAFTSEKVAACEIFMSTTNGTKAIVACREARATLVCSRQNLIVTGAALVGWDQNVVLVCAGTGGKPAFEDEYVAAELAFAIDRVGNPTFFGKAMGQLHAAKARPYGVNADFENSEGEATLRSLGLEEDIQFAGSNVCNESPLCAVGVHPHMASKPLRVTRHVAANLP